MRSAALVAALAVLLSARRAHAHAEHLGQSAYLTVSDRAADLELEVSPGAQVAAAFARLADRDGDGVLSETEKTAVGNAVLRDLLLVVDGRTVPFTLLGVSAPPLAVLATGEAALGLRAHAPLAPLAGGTHRVTFTNRYAPVRSAYLAHAFGVQGVSEVSPLARSTTYDELTCAVRVTRALPLAASAASTAPRRSVWWLPLAGLSVGLTAWLAQRSTSRERR